jgi:hypothetical protein
MKKVNITKRTQISGRCGFRTLRVMNQLQNSGVGIRYTRRMKTKPSSGHKGGGWIRLVGLGHPALQLRQWLRTRRRVAEETDANDWELGARFGSPRAYGVVTEGHVAGDTLDVPLDEVILPDL